MCVREKEKVRKSNTISISSLIILIIIKNIIIHTMQRFYKIMLMIRRQLAKSKFKKITTVEEGAGEIEDK